MIRDAAVCMLNKPVLDRLAGGPICCDKNACRGRNVTDCAFGSSRQWRAAWPLDTTSTASPARRRAVQLAERPLAPLVRAEPVEDESEHGL